MSSHTSANELSALEPGQLAAAKRRPFPRAKISRGVWLMLFALQIYVIIAVPLVIYAFIRALQAGN